MSGKEELLAELKVREEKLKNRIFDLYNTDNSLNEVQESDKIYINKHLDFYYEYYLSNLTKESILPDELFIFNKKMIESVNRRTPLKEGSNIDKYLKLYLELYNIGIEKEYLKLRYD